MSGIEPVVALAAIASAAAVAGLVALLVPPLPRLAQRVRPYTVAARASLGRPADAAALARLDAGPTGGTMRRLLEPLLGPLAARFGRLLDGSSDEHLLLKLRHAGLFADLPDEHRVHEHHARQLGMTIGGAVVGAALALATGRGAAVALLATVLGGFAGASRWRGRIDRAIDDRRARMRIELYTVNQLLAMQVRIGGGVLQAVQRVVERGHGAVVDELAEMLRAHEAGSRAVDALERTARLTPEPHAARTYKLLATGVEWGADLADALLALSDDVRDARRDALRRQATRRRAGMLVPIIGVLAPVMLLFIAAPIPSIVFGAR